MKKKTVKKKKKQSKPKTDSVHYSLAVMKQMILDLEQQIKELMIKVESLHTQKYYYPKDAEPKKYWPNHEREWPYQPYIWW